MAALDAREPFELGGDNGDRDVRAVWVVIRLQEQTLRHSHIHTNYDDKRRLVADVTCVFFVYH